MPIVQANGIDINYEVQGEGEPVVLIPYLAADQACYAFQTADYVKHFTCFTVDLRGAGLSSKPEGICTTELFADDIAAFMQVAGIDRASADAGLPAHSFRVTPRPEIPITGGRPHDCGRSIAPGPARAAPLDLLLLGQQIIGVGLDEQLHEHRMHDAPPRGRWRCSLRAVPLPGRGPRATVDTFREHCHPARCARGGLGIVGRGLRPPVVWGCRWRAW